MLAELGTGLGLPGFFPGKETAQTRIYPSMSLRVVGLLRIVRVARITGNPKIVIGKVGKERLFAF